MKFLLFLVLVGQSPATEGVIAMPVQHKHTIGACEGTLVFSPDGVRYDTEEEDDQRSWSYADVKFFEIVSDDELRLHTFEDHGILRLGQDRKFVFEQVQGPMGVDFYNMLRERSPLSAWPNSCWLHIARWYSTSASTEARSPAGIPRPPNSIKDLLPASVRPTEH